MLVTSVSCWEQITNEAFTLPTRAVASVFRTLVALAFDDRPSDRHDCPPFTTAGDARAYATSSPWYASCHSGRSFELALPPEVLAMKSQKWIQMQKKKHYGQKREGGYCMLTWGNRCIFTTTKDVQALISVLHA